MTHIARNKPYINYSANFDWVTYADIMQKVTAFNHKIAQTKRSITSITNKTIFEEKKTQPQYLAIVFHFKLT